MRETADFPTTIREAAERNLLHQKTTCTVTVRHFAHLIEHVSVSRPYVSVLSAFVTRFDSLVAVEVRNAVLTSA